MGMGAVIGGSIVIALLVYFALSTFVLTCIVFGKYFYIRHLAKKHNVPFKALLGKRLRINFIILGIAYAMILLVVLMFISDTSSKPSVNVFNHFYAKKDYQHGAVTFPKGTLVYRDAYMSNSERTGDIGLSGLKSARFAEPIMMRNILVSAIEIYPLRLELAEDTAIGPVHHLQYEAESNRMILVEDTAIPSLICKKGDVALFVDLSDEVKETLENKKFGLDAHLVPEAWQFVKCETNYQIKVPNPLKQISKQYSYPLKTIDSLSDDAVSALTDYYSALKSKDPEALSQAMIRLQVLADEGQEDVQYIVDQIKKE